MLINIFIRQTVAWFSIKWSYLLSKTGKMCLHVRFFFNCDRLPAVMEDRKGRFSYTIHLFCSNFTFAYEPGHVISPFLLFHNFHAKCVHYISACYWTISFHLGTDVSLSNHYFRFLIHQIIQFCNLFLAFAQVALQILAHGGSWKMSI